MRIQHRNRSHGLSSSETLRYKSNQDLYTESGSGQTSECPFSSVSTPPIARVGAFCSNYCRDLQNVLSFARLRLQNLSKMLLHFFRVCSKTLYRNGAKFLSKCIQMQRNFIRILQARCCLACRSCNSGSKNGEKNAILDA